MQKIPDVVWQRVVSYIGLERKLRKIKKRDWRFECARAMVGKCCKTARNLGHLRYRNQLYQETVKMLRYFVYRTRRYHLDKTLLHRVLMSEVKVRGGTATTIDYKRVRMMSSFRVCELMCKHAFLRASQSAFTHLSIRIPRRPRLLL